MILFTQFIEEKSTQLLKLLHLRSLKGPKLAASMTFVEDVLHDFYTEFSEFDLPDPEPQERVFWSAVYKLEEATEALMVQLSSPETNHSICSHVKELEVNLLRREYSLRCGHHLVEFYASRPERIPGSGLSLPLF